MKHSLRIIYAGTPDFSVAALETLIASSYEVVAVYTQPDRPAGRGRASGRHLKASPVKEKALAHNIPVFQPESLKDQAAVQALRDLHADLMIVAAYGLLLPSAVLEAPRFGCINIHASLLSRWRGAAPIQRAILADDKKTGITIMQMDEGLDTGDILAVAECEITAEDTGSSLHDKLMLLGAETLMSALPAIIEAYTIESNVTRATTSEYQSNRIKQNDADATYARKLIKTEAKIDWQLSADEIQRAVRAYNAWPVAYCSYEKNNKLSVLRVWQAEVLSNKDIADLSRQDEVSPGTVIAESASVGKAGVDVVTGQGVLRITQLQAEGKRKMLAVDFLNANSLLGQQLK